MNSREKERNIRITFVMNEIKKVPDKITLMYKIMRMWGCSKRVAKEYIEVASNGK